jgi:hypothetical protein
MLWGETSGNVMDSQEGTKKTVNSGIGELRVKKMSRSLLAVLEVA